MPLLPTPPNGSSGEAMKITASFTHTLPALTRPSTASSSALLFVNTYSASGFGPAADPDVMDHLAGMALDTSPLQRMLNHVRQQLALVGGSGYLINLGVSSVAVATPA